MYRFTLLIVLYAYVKQPSISLTDEYKQCHLHISMGICGMNRLAFLKYIWLYS